MKFSDSDTDGHSRCRSISSGSKIESSQIVPDWTSEVTDGS